MTPTATTGRVTLVGGGPGDVALLTIAAVEALRAADAVVYDRLAPVDALALYAPQAEHIDVGKKPGHHPVDQRGIERVILDLAVAGRHVVRLKGGDSFVFGRGGEEVDACREAGIPVTVVPGVTSAIAVPAAAGIPVTRRGINHLFTVISGHAPLTTEELDHLAGLGGTIVVLMGVGTLPHLTHGLLRSGMRADMPVAVIERGLHPDQRTTIASLSEVVQVASTAQISSPAVIVIGDVVRNTSAVHEIVARVDVAG